MELTQYCKILCKKSHSEQQLASFATRIEEAYKVNWIIDNIPAATKYYSLTEEAAEKAATDPDSVTDADYVIRYDKVSVCYALCVGGVLCICVSPS